MAQELKAYNVVATVDVNPEVVDSLGCTEFAAYDADEVDAVLAEKDKNIAELKAKLQDHCTTCPVKEQEESVLAEKDSEIRRLKRALWLARAGEAAKEVNYWTCENASSYAIADFNVHHETIISYKAPHHRPYKWILIWENVERKCRAKAEEALLWLRKRTMGRENRGVEGTHKV